MITGKIKKILQKGVLDKKYDLMKELKNTLYVVRAG